MLAVTEIVLAVNPENIADRHTLLLLNQTVGVHQLASGVERQLVADRGLAAAHKTKQHDIFIHHSPSPVYLLAVKCSFI